MNAASAPAAADTVALPRPTLLQFWDAEVPDAVQPLLASVQAHNPELDYRCFDDGQAADFIVDNYGADIAQLYRSCAIPAMRSDLFRYCYLLQHGGFYVDADYRCLGPIDELLVAAPRAQLLLRKNGLANGMMYFADAQDPLMQRILDSALTNIRARRSNNVWSVTGPSVLRRLLADAATAPLFDGVDQVDEARFHRVFASVPKLAYKERDDYWLNARRLGLSLFRDA